MSLVSAQLGRRARHHRSNRRDHISSIDAKRDLGGRRERPILGHQQPCVDRKPRRCTGHVEPRAVDEAGREPPRMRHTSDLQHARPAANAVGRDRRRVRHADAGPEPTQDQHVIHADRCRAAVVHRCRHGDRVADGDRFTRGSHVDDDATRVEERAHRAVARRRQRLGEVRQRAGAVRRRRFGAVNLAACIGG